MTEDEKKYNTHTTITEGNNGAWAVLSVHRTKSAASVSLSTEQGITLLNTFDTPKEATDSYERTLRQLTDEIGERVLWHGQPCYG